MGLLVECMCLECGISTYLDMDNITVEDLGGGIKVVSNAYCPDCQGGLRVIGKAGAEPYYKIELT